MKNFFECKDEKITEKAFSQSLIISVVSILLCLVALCSMTYAWFTGSTSSGNNTLTSGSFDVTVSISKTDGDVSTASIPVVFADGKYTLTEAGTYTVTLTPTDDTTVKGYCVVTINEETAKSQRTIVITNDKTESTEYTKNAPFTFKIVTTESNTVVEIEAHWGVPADPVIANGGNLTVEVKQTSSEGNEASE